MSKSSVVTWGNGLKIQMVDLATMKANPWNPNRMSDEIFAKEILSIQNNGFVEPIKIRELTDGSYEIVDGEHRWRAATQLGLGFVPCVNLGPISDAQAKKLTIIANELRGAPEPVRLAALIKDLNTDITLEDLALELPMTRVELDSLVRSATPFDWGAIESGLPDVSTKETAQAALGNGKRFQIGSVKGDIAATLCDELMAEYNRSAAASSSANPETVLRHWLERLKATADATDALAAAAPQPVKRSRKAAQP